MTKFILEGFCRAFSVNLLILTLDSNAEYKIIENIQNKEGTEKNMVILNDSIYLLEKIQTTTQKPEKIIIESPTTQTSKKSQENGKENIQKKIEKINEPRQKSLKGENNSMLIQSESNSENQMIVDDYNKLSIYFLVDCKGCHNMISSVYRESFKKCVCKILIKSEIWRKENGKM